MKSCLEKLISQKNKHLPWDCVQCNSEESQWRVPSDEIPDDNLCWFHLGKRKRIEENVEEASTHIAFLTDEEVEKLNEIFNKPLPQHYGVRIDRNKGRYRG